MIFIFYTGFCTGPSASGMSEGLKIWGGPGRAVIGGHNLPPPLEIGLTNLQKIRGGGRAAPLPPPSDIPTA